MLSKEEMEIAKRSYDHARENGDLGVMPGPEEMGPPPPSLPTGPPKGQSSPARSETPDFNKGNVRLHHRAVCCGAVVFCTVLYCTILSIQ